MKILFLHNEPAVFVKLDLKILRTAFDVREVYIDHSTPQRLIGSISEAIRSITWADLIYSWFGGFHALLPFFFGRIFGRKCVVIASGYDVANAPEINYGNMRPGFRRWVGLSVFRLSHQVLAVSNFAAEEAARNARVPVEKIKVIHHGLEDPTPYDEGIRTERKGVLTVGNVSHLNLTRKGLHHFVKTASFFPDVPFILIGPWQDDSIDILKKNASSNVVFLGPCYGEQLFNYMKTSKVYVQASAYESFGMSLAEAMLCGCLPVVTNRGALPEVVGETGYLVAYNNMKDTVEAIHQALSAGPEAGRYCRQRILEGFSLKNRRENILHVLEGHFSK